MSYWLKYAWNWSQALESELGLDKDIKSVGTSMQYVSRTL